MPWRYRWERPYDEELVSAMARAGFNGGVCDFLPRDDAELHERHGLLWYLDHAAGRGDLHLSERWNTKAYRNGLRRPRCLLDPKLQEELRERVARSVGQAKAYKTCIAYALDDEVSWSTMTNPCRWDNHPLSIRDFRRWLLRRYGTRGGILQQWGHQADEFLTRMATPDDFQDLYRRPTSQWNLSPWCDALTYMDSQLLNLVGELVLHAHQVDGQRPCGLVGAQGPAPYGGYDYAKLMRKVRFLEVYNIGAAMEIARSFSQHNEVALVAAGTGDPQSRDGTWWPWYGLAHGFRGSIVFAENWFSNDSDRFRLGPMIRDVARASKKLLGGTWQHDGIAIYYSQPSVQVSWFMDCHVHGRTWINRLSSMDNRLSSMNATFWAWTKLLEDAHLQYDFLSYADLIVSSLDPAEYKALILPRALALSDLEARRIEEYVHKGGVVLADHMLGIFDHHGRGRMRGALDHLLGIQEHPPVMAGTVFGGRFLTEFDAETHWNGTFLAAGQPVWAKCKRSRGLPIAERSLGPFIAGRHGEGWIMLMNVSLAEYCLHRVQRSSEAGEIRGHVVDLLRRAGVAPWVFLRVEGREPAATEVTSWLREGRRYVCVVKNPLRLGTLQQDGQGAAGAGGPLGEETGPVRLEVRFAEPQRDVIDERRDTALGKGRAFEIPWKTDQAAILSMVWEDSQARKVKAPVSTSRP